MSKYPPIQVVDKNDKPISGASLQDVHDKGLIHRAVLIFVEDTNGRILLQKRGPKVATHPNKWDISSAGHVDEGEEYLIAAYRELFEELGLKDFNLTEIDSLYLETMAGERRLNRFVKVYKTIVPANTPITIQKSELADTQWLSENEIRLLIKLHPDEVHDDLAVFMDKYYSQN